MEATPIGFIEGILGLPLYPWQDKTLAPLARAGWGKKIIQITCLAPNEGGKSSRVVSGSALYWLARFKKGRVGITTKDSKQLNEQIIPAIEAQLHKMEGWKSVRAPYYRVTTPDGGVIIAFTTDDSARVEGLHGAPDAPLLWIVDEAKSVPEPIFSGIDRCGYQALIYCSSGGMMTGTFYESHYGKMSKGFRQVRAGLIDCPHIAPEKVQRIIEKYGEHNPFTRSSVYGEFMEQSDTDEFCVDLRSLLNCLNSPPDHKPGLKAGFCDFGAGVAEHVLATRDGNKYEISAAWIESNKDATAGRFIREFIKAGFTAERATDELSCDASDKEIWQKLANAGWVLHRQNGGAPPRLKQEYKSWQAEAWLEGAIKIHNSDVILPDDPILKAQLVDRKKGYTNAGKMCVEDKLEMAKRGVVSPDRADAIFGVMNRPEDLFINAKMPLPNWMDALDEFEETNVMQGLGAYAGS